jgi:hypothetical protein
MSAGEAQKGGEIPSKISSIERGRTFVLFGGFLAGTLTSGWIGLVVTFATGIATFNPPRFPGGNVVRLKS